MTRILLKRRNRLGLIVVVAIAASFAASGASRALAGVITGNCPSSGVTCLWADKNYLPTDEKLSLQGTNPDYRIFGDPADDCGGLVSHTWNDCASSVQNRFSATTFYAWSNIHCAGVQFPIVAGRNIADLSSVGHNDEI